MNKGIKVILISNILIMAVLSYFVFSVPKSNAVVLLILGAGITSLMGYITYFKIKEVEKITFSSITTALIISFFVTVFSLYLLVDGYTLFSNTTLYIFSGLFAIFVIAYYKDKLASREDDTQLEEIYEALKSAESDNLHQYQIENEEYVK